MKNILLLATGLLIFGCENSNRTTESETNSETISDESVEKGAGSEISPQLEGINDSAVRLNVDTISSSPEAQKTE